MCYAWDGKVDYEGYLKLVGDVLIKLGQWVHSAYGEDMVVLELCSQVVSLLSEIQEQLHFGFFDDRLMRRVVPVLRKFVKSDYPCDGCGDGLEYLMRFVGALERVRFNIQPLVRQINWEKAEEDWRRASLEFQDGAGDSSKK